MLRNIERPITLQGDLANLPDALEPLKALRNWVCWKHELRGDNWTKPPYQPQGSYAKNNDPATWCYYDEALAAYQSGGFDGIGFNLLGTGYDAFDIDNCRDLGSDVVAPEATALVKRAASYTEITPSGTGLRVIGKSSGGNGKVHRKQKLPGCNVEVESYRDAERYITITGNPQPGTPQHMSNFSAVLDELVAKLDGGKANGSGGSLDEWIAARGHRHESDGDFKPDDSYLPSGLKALITKTPRPKDEDRSETFYHVVCWLSELDWSARKIDAYIDGKPVVPERYNGRLQHQIYRCLRKSEMRKQTKQEQPSAKRDTTEGELQPFEVFRHGEPHADELVSWLVKDLIFETGTGLASGPWGTGKTFVVLDMAGSMITGTPFAGREVARQGGVLFVAAEGASQIRIRLEALVEAKLRPAGEAAGQPIALKLPYSWITDCPDLQDDDAFARLVMTATREAERFSERFNLPLVLIVIDTLSAAGNFKDANDAAEGQRIMNRLAELGRETGAFVLAVDHFGKAQEAGTRGSSAKEAAADVVLAILADREINGTISNTRMALRKLRGGQVGVETPFGLRWVDMGGANSTCVVDWQTVLAEQAKPVERWPKSLRIFRTALSDVFTKYLTAGETEVHGAPLDEVRHEFTAIYPAADASDPKEAKRKAFARALKEASNRELIGCREIGGVDYLWLLVA